MSLARLSSFLFPLTVGSLLPGLAAAAVTASSYYKDPLKDEYAYAPTAATDGNPESAWIEGAEDDGIGAWLQIDVPKGTILKLQVQTGMGSKADDTKRFGRVKDAMIEVFTLDEAQNQVPVKQVPFQFKDEPGMQEIPLGGAVEVGSELWGGRIKLTIRSVNRGADFDSATAVGEVLAIYKEDEASVVVNEVGGEAPGGSKQALVDEDLGSAWIAPAGADAWFEVEAPDWAISGLGMLPGNNKNPQAWKANARVKDVEVLVNNQSVLHTFEDKPVVQFVAFPVKDGTNGGHFGPVKVTIRSVYPGAQNQNAAVSEVKIRAISFTQ